MQKGRNRYDQRHHTDGPRAWCFENSWKPMSDHVGIAKHWLTGTQGEVLRGCLQPHGGNRFVKALIVRNP